MTVEWVGMILAVTKLHHPATYGDAAARGLAIPGAPPSDTVSAIRKG